MNIVRNEMKFALLILCQICLREFVQLVKCHKKTNKLIILITAQVKMPKFFNPNCVHTESVRLKFFTFTR